MTRDIIGEISLYDMFLLFFIYGFLGYCTEVIYAALKKGKFINRGFLYGPVCPIYGTGVAILTLLLYSIRDKWWLLFIAGTVLCTLIEFLTGFVLEKIFKTKWWDYSNRKYNIKGYVCLKFSLLWGLAIVVIFDTVLPLTMDIINRLPFNVGLVLIVLFSVIMILDFISVLISIYKIHQGIKEVNKLAALLSKGSVTIGEKLSSMTLLVKEKLDKLNEKVKRAHIGKSFPNLLKKGDVLYSEFEKTKQELDKINEETEKTVKNDK